MILAHTLSLGRLWYGKREKGINKENERVENKISSILLLGRLDRLGPLRPCLSFNLRNKWRRHRRLCNRINQTKARGQDSVQVKLLASYTSNRWSTKQGKIYRQTEIKGEVSRRFGVISKTTKRFCIKGKVSPIFNVTLNSKKTYLYGRKR